MIIEYAKIKYWLYRFFWRHPSLHRGPVHLDLEINNTCNQKCVACWHSRPKLPYPIRKMDKENVLRVLTMGRRAGCLSVKFNLRGEPTLHRFLPDMISHAKLIGYVETMINTNGTASSEIMRKILDAGIDKVIVSVDSLDAEIYKHLHGATQEQYAQIIENLGYLYDHARDRMEINVHVSKINEHDNPVTIRACYPGIVVRFKHIEARGGDDIRTDAAKTKRRFKGCPHIRRRLTVQSDGKVWPCCLCYDSPDDIRIGNLYTRGSNLKNIWNGKKRRAILSAHRAGAFPASCKNCKSGDVWTV